MKKGSYLFLNEYGFIYQLIFISIDDFNIVPELNRFGENLYYLVIFDNNRRDYTSVSKFNEIETLIKDMNAINILDNNYHKLKEVLPNLKENEFEYYLNFATEQLKNYNLK